MKDIEENYVLVKEEVVRPLLWLIFTLLLILIPLVVIDLKLALFIGIIDSFVLVNYHIYRRRYCTNCKEKMTATPKGLLTFPEYYYCSNCKLKISTGIENDSWS